MTPQDIFITFRKLTLTLLVATMLPLSLRAEYILKPITLDDGLSQSSANTVFRDRKGYVWIGTDYGLNRYDNRDIVQYFADGKPGSIPENQVRVITQDTNGDLLIGLEHGIVRYNYYTDMFEPVNLNGKLIDVRSARQVPGGTALGGYGRFYLYGSDSRELTELLIKCGTTNSFNYISRLWRNDTYLLNSQNDGVWTYTLGNQELKKLEFIEDKDVSSILVDSEGKLWVSYFNEGLKCYDRRGQLLLEINTQNSALESNIILDIMELGDDIWLATELGIDIYDREKQIVRNLHNIINGPKNYTVLRLFSDDKGTIYAGTLRHGVLCIKRVPIRTIRHMENVRSEFGFTVTSIVNNPADNTVWIGIDGDGVANFDPSTEIMKHYPSTHNLKVTSMLLLDPRRLLLATYNKGMQILDVETGELTKAPGVYDKIGALSRNKALPTDIFKLNDGRVAAVTDMLCTIDPKTETMDVTGFTVVRGNRENLAPFFNDGEQLLMHDRHNIFRYKADADTCGVLLSLPEEQDIRCAAFDGKDGLWISTALGLLHFNTKTGKTEKKNTEYLDNISSLTVEGDRLWVGADNQLYMVDGDMVTVFGRDAGVFSNQFINKSELLTDKYLLLGGVNGMVKINRSGIDKLISQPTSTSISLSEVLVDKKHANIDENGKVKVPHDHNNIQIKVIDSDIGGVRNKLLRYEVEGFKRDYSFDTFDRTLTFNMLEPGKYKVYVRYNLNNGEWSDPVYLTQIEVQSPWWMSWWATMIVLIIVIVASVILFQANQVRRQRNIEEIKRGALEDKLGFLTKIHSELRTPLALVLMPLKNLLDTLKDTNEEKDQHTIEALTEIYDNSMQMRDIIDKLPEKHDLSSFMSAAHNENYEITAHKTDDYDADDDHEEGFADSYDTSHYTAVVVESNNKLCTYIVDQLSATFKQVRSANNGKDAMLLIRDTQPDIIVADVALDDIDGFEVCREIKKTESLRHIPVILLTSGNAEKEKRKSYTHGADSYISKPFDINMLISRCKNLLMNRAIMRRRYEGSSQTDEIAKLPVSNSDETFILELDKLMREHIHEPDFGVEFLSKKMLISRTAFYARMKQITGKSIGQYIADYRLEQAKKMLSNQSLSILDISERLGFRSQRYFSTFFKDKMGVTPTEYRNSEK